MVRPLAPNGGPSSPVWGSPGSAAARQSGAPAARPRPRASACSRRHAPPPGLASAPPAQPGSAAAPPEAARAAPTPRPADSPRTAQVRTSHCNTARAGVKRTPVREVCKWPCAPLVGLQVLHIGWQVSADPEPPQRLSRVVALASTLFVEPTNGGQSRGRQPCRVERARLRAPRQPVDQRAEGVLDAVRSRLAAAVALLVLGVQRRAGRHGCLQRGPQHCVDVIRRGRAPVPGSGQQPTCCCPRGVRRNRFRAGGLSPRCSKALIRDPLQGTTRV